MQAEIWIRSNFTIFFSRNHCSELDKKKPVVICGDLNVAHKEIDLANPKTNKKSAGFTQEERDSMSFNLTNHFYLGL